MKHSRIYVFLLSLGFIMITSAYAENKTGEKGDVDTYINSPLTLKNRGSFFIGGDKVEQTKAELGEKRPADSITVNQMYVEYMVAAGKETSPPIVMIHGAGLSGESYDTTPDGRIGWYEYFVRNHSPVYVVDQVGRARSGFNQAVFNNVQMGLTPPESQPRFVRLGDKIAGWVNFRIGPKPGVAYSGTQFPVNAIDKLSQAGIPDLTDSMPAPNPTYKALGLLSEKLKGSILLGHSQSGAFPLETALSYSHFIKGMISVEPGSCNGSKFTEANIKTLSTIPLLIVYGDHLNTPTGLPGAGWPQRFDDCKVLVSRMNNAGGNARIIHLPEIGIKGNTHMMMWDKNNLQVADVILGWVHKNIK